ncbi:MAG: hypothetical protein CVU67_08090, partial [Deltaproteobacteria bacterium HGW-Deltaproteobacteria-24]
GSGVQISDTASSILNFTIETAGPVYFENNGSSNQTINIHGDLDIGAASNGYSVGNEASYGATYKNGVYIGNYNNFTADNINIRGKGFDYTSSFYNGQGKIGGEGILVGSNTNILSITDINLKGQGGAGSNASDASHAENNVVISGSTGSNYNTSAGNAGSTQPSSVSSGSGTTAYGATGASSYGGQGSSGSNGNSASNTAAAGGNGVSVSSSTIIEAGRDLNVIGIGGKGGNGGRGGNGGMGDTGGTAQNGQGGGNATGGNTSGTYQQFSHYDYPYDGSGPYNSFGQWIGYGQSGSGYYQRANYVTAYYYGGTGTGGTGGNSIGGTGGTGGTGGSGSSGAIGGVGIKVTSAILEAGRDLKLEATGGA